MAKKKLSIKDLKPAPYNPRTIKPEAIAGLQSSLDKFGDIAGITWNKRTGNLVAGHQRMESLKRLYGEDKLVFDGVKISCPDGKEFTVRVVDWDEPMEKAANITANNTFLQGDFTAELESLMSEVGEYDYTLLSDLKMNELLDSLKDIAESNEVILDKDKLSGERTSHSTDKKYAVEIECVDEAEQRKVLTELTKAGYECKGLIF